MAFFPKDAKCYNLYTRGPCSRGKLLVLDTDQIAKCMVCIDRLWKGHWPHFISFKLLYSARTLENYLITTIAIRKHVMSTLQKDHAKELENYFCPTEIADVIQNCLIFTPIHINVMKLVLMRFNDNKLQISTIINIFFCRKNWTLS